MEDRFPTLEEWAEAPVIKFAKDKDKIIQNWALKISQMDETLRLDVLTDIRRTSPLIYRQIQRYLNQGEKK